MLFVIGNLYKHMSGLSLTHETKLFHFHGIFMKNEIKSAKRTPTHLYIRTPIPEILDPPLGKPNKDISSARTCQLMESIRLKCKVNSLT